MQRLLKDAEALTGVHYDISNYADVVDAIHAVQTEMGISGYSVEELQGKLDGMSLTSDEVARVADSMGISYEEAMQRMQDGTLTTQDAQVLLGTTAKEASTTIEGSVNAMKGAWDNWLVALATDDVNFDEKTQQLLDSIQTVAMNVLPRLGTVIGTIIAELPNLIGEIAAQLPSMMGPLQEAIAQSLSESMGGIDALGPLQGLADSFMGAFSEIMEAAQPLGESFGNAFSSISETIMSIMPSIEGTISNLGSIIAGIMPIVSEVVDFVSAVIAEVYPVVAPIIESITALVAECMPQIQEIVGTVLGAIQSVVAAVMPAIKAVFDAVWPHVANIVRTAVGVIKGVIEGIAGVVGTVVSIFNGIKDAICNPVETAKGVVKTVVDTIKGFFSNFHITLPHISLPHFSISPSGWQVGDLLKGSIPHLSVQWYAKGGFVDGATLIGAGERGAEMILPRRGALMDEFATAVASKGARGINATFIVNGGTDPEAFARQAMRSINRLARAEG